MKTKLKILLCFLVFSLPAFALEVVSLHPLISDWARQVGGEKVMVVNVVKPGTELHNFKPGAKQLRALSRARLILASGKGIEPYLGSLRDALKEGQEIVELGRIIPAVFVDEDHDHGHEHGHVDPHWWHDVSNAERAVRLLGRVFAKADPENAGLYQKNAREAAGKLEKLDKWVKAQVATVPRKQRHLVTAHAAFGYFCEAYGFEATHLQGLSRDGEISARELAESIRGLRAEGIRAVFPETQANPKMLQQIARGSGAKTGPALHADGSVESYEKMMRGNVKAIVEALGGESGS